MMGMVSVAPETCRKTSGQILGSGLNFFSVSDTACLLICLNSSCVVCGLFLYVLFSNFPTENSHVFWYLSKQTIKDSWLFCLKNVTYVGHSHISGWGVHRLAVTKRYNPSRHLIILNNAIIFPIYRSERTVPENMVLDLEIKTQKKIR
jgi:hypothetical protein